MAYKFAVAGSAPEGRSFTALGPTFCSDNERLDRINISALSPNLWDYLHRLADGHYRDLLLVASWETPLASPLSACFGDNDTARRTLPLTLSLARFTHSKMLQCLEIVAVLDKAILLCLESFKINCVRTESEGHLELA